MSQISIFFWGLPLFPVGQGGTPLGFTKLQLGATVSFRDRISYTVFPLYGSAQRDLSWISGVFPTKETQCNIFYLENQPPITAVTL